MPRGGFILKISNALKTTPAGNALLELVEEATKKKRDPIRSIKLERKQRLGIWARARISDRALKMLFKELIGACRKHMNSTNTTNTVDIK